MMTSPLKWRRIGGRSGRDSRSVYSASVIPGVQDLRPRASNTEMADGGALVCVCGAGAGADGGERVTTAAAAAFSSLFLRVAKDLIVNRLRVAAKRTQRVDAAEGRGAHLAAAASGVEN